MTDTNPIILVLIINGLNKLKNRADTVRLDRKTRSNYMLSKGDIF